MLVDGGLGAVTKVPGFRLPKQSKIQLEHFTVGVHKATGLNAIFSQEKWHS
jgi:hypothetical protein